LEEIIVARSSDITSLEKELEEVNSMSDTKLAELTTELSAKESACTSLQENLQAAENEAVRIQTEMQAALAEVYIFV
jgi:peptidoglycan hydrolase CwlO-like protein